MEAQRSNPLIHATIYLLARGLPGIIAFLAIPLFSRLLSPSEYGQYALVIAGVSVANALLFQWLRLSLLRYLPAYRDAPQRLKSTLLTMTALLILSVGAVGGILCLLPGMQAWQPVIVAGWMLLSVQALFELFCEYTRGNLQPWRFMLMQMMRTTTAIALGVGLVLAGWGWKGPLTGLMAGMAIAVLYALRGDWTGVRLRVDRQILGRLAMYGLPLSLTVALAIVISSSDRFLIDWFMGREATGLYAVAFDFTAQTLTLLMLSINMAVFPIAVRALEHEGPEAARRQMRSNAALLMGVGTPSVIGLVILAPGIAYCFLGEQFRATAAQIIPLIAVGAFLEGLKAFHFDAAFQFAHRTIKQVWIVLFVALINIVLNLLVIPRWGINGAAGASVAAYVLSVGLTIWLGRKHFAVPFPLLPGMQVLCAAAVMGVVLYPFRPYLSGPAVAGQIALGAAVYGTGLIALNFMGSRDAVMRRLRRGEIATLAAHDGVALDGTALRGQL